MLDQRGQLLRAAVGFGCSMPSYDRALWALRSGLDSWSGIGHIAVGMHRQGFDLQLIQYDDRGWRATFYTTGMEHSPTSAIGTSWDRTAWRADAAGGVGGAAERGGDTMSGALMSLGVALVAVAAAQAAPVSVGELLSDPDRFSGRPVTVSRTMSNFREHVTRTRTRYYTFYFSDGTETVRVISYEKPPCQARTATVEGTFRQVKWRVRVNYSYEEITAWTVTCLPGDGPKTK